MIIDANAFEEMGSRFSSPVSRSRHSTTKGALGRKRCIRRPTYGIHRSPEEQLTEKRFPKSPLLRNNSCMRAELNATQSPLTMSKCAQHARAGPCVALLIAVSSGISFQLGKKKPPSRRGLHFYGVVGLGLIKDQGILQECHPSCCFPSFGR